MKVPDDRHPRLLYLLLNTGLAQVRQGDHPHDDLFSNSSNPPASLARLFCEINLSSAADLALKETSSMSRFKNGEIEAIVLAPLEKASFEPDRILFYGNPGQSRSGDAFGSSLVLYDRRARLALLLPIRTSSRSSRRPTRNRGKNWGFCNTSATGRPLDKKSRAHPTLFSHLAISRVRILLLFHEVLKA
jgi:hypothetical protein